METCASKWRPPICARRWSSITSRTPAVLGLAVQGNPAAESVLRLGDSRDVLVSAARLLTPAALFLKTDGASTGITLDGGDLSKANRVR